MSTRDSTATDLEAVRLRAEMVEQLREHGELRTDAVAEAFARVAREVFAPGASLAEVYDRDVAVITKRDSNGLATSSVSAPRIQALMLEQADIKAGMRVLEIGSGGYNAALVAELVGPDGEVTTIDIDPFVTDRATQFLGAAGYPQVRVLCRDAVSGAAEHTPYDRIIVTAGAWDIPPAWIAQLAEGGVLVVPLRIRGLTRSLALVRDGVRLRDRSCVPCGFVPILGADAAAQHLVKLHGDDVALRLDEDHRLNERALAAALASPRMVCPTGVTVGGLEAFDDLDLFLAATLDEFGLLVATPEAIESGLVGRSARMGAKTVIAGAASPTATRRRPRRSARRSSSWSTGTARAPPTSWPPT